MDTEPESKKQNVLIYSSFVFLTNFIAGIWIGQTIYAALFLALTCSSVAVHHYEDLLWINILDKLIIFSIFLFGAFEIFTKFKTHVSTHLVIIVSSFVYCIVVYIIGYLNTCFCFDLCPDIAKTYHMHMHIVGSVGHHYIMFL